MKQETVVNQNKKLSEDLAQAIEGKLQKMGKNKSWLAKELGVTPQYITDVLGTRKRFSGLNRIAIFLGLNVGLSISEEKDSPEKVG